MLTRIIILLLIFLPSFAHADSDIFSYTKRLFKSDIEIDKIIVKYMCDNHLGKYFRAKQIAKAELFIEDFKYKSGDVDLLGIGINPISILKKNDIRKEEIYNSFIESIKTHNPEREIAFYIYDEFEQYNKKCYKPKKGKDHRKKCRKKAESYISAKYGNATVKFFCKLKVKGTKYPILIESNCSVAASDNFSGDKNVELHDLDALKETTIKDGVKRLLDRQIESLSELFDIAKQCK